MLSVTALLGLAATSGTRLEESKTGDVGPGLMAFLIVAALAVATFFLVRSMLAQIKKVPPTFDPPTGHGEGEDPPSTTTERDG